MDEQPPRTHHPQDAVDMLHRRLGEQRDREENGQGRAVGREGRRAREPAAHKHHRPAIRERHRDQECCAHHGRYWVLFRNWPNADVALSSSASTAAIEVSASWNEYCIAPTAKASARASSASVTI